MNRLKTVLIIVSILSIVAVGSYFGKQTYDDFTKAGSKPIPAKSWQDILHDSLSGK